MQLEESIDRNSSLIERFVVTAELYELQTNSEKCRVIVCPNHVHIIDKDTPIHLTKFDYVDLSCMFREMYKNTIIDIKMYDTQIEISPLVPPRTYKINEYNTAIGKGELRVKVDIESVGRKGAYNLTKTSHGVHSS